MNSAELAGLALAQVGKALSKLSDEDLRALVEGRAHFELRHKPVTVTAPVMRVTDAVHAINTMTTSAEVLSYLERMKFSATQLRALARALGPTVSARGDAEQLKLNIADGTAGFRERAAAIGAWGPSAWAPSANPLVADPLD